ncbi:MAG: hypothetical protein HY649_10880, partial [Acidobacteria bacterium]|nr:hypothetical protein [Acidobacteriota bacterium]
MTLPVADPKLWQKASRLSYNIEVAMSEPSEQSPWKRLLSPWKIAAALLAVVLVVEVYLSWQD